MDAEFQRAVASLWLDTRPSNASLVKIPEFLRLKGICEQHYPELSWRSGSEWGLANALRGLGLPRELPEGRPDLSMSPEVAAARLDRALSATTVAVRHLCPLNCAGELPELRFGPNWVGYMAADTFEAMVDAPRLARTHGGRGPDIFRLRNFAWLIVEETVAVSSSPAGRAIPALDMNFGRDFGAIEPHQSKVPPAVERALLTLLLAPWEHWTDRRVEWRAFHIPWVYSVSEDLLANPPSMPSADSLEWQPDTAITWDGEEVEIERPIRYPLADEAAAELPYHLNDTAWLATEAARGCELLGDPVPHFFVRGFLDRGIDEYLAHMTTIDAALGQEIDYHPGGRPLVGTKNPGATERLAKRISALLGDAAASSQFKHLFDIRSAFVHGRAMGEISSADRVLARRLARRVLAALVTAAQRDGTCTRSAYLDELLQRGASSTENQ